MSLDRDLLAIESQLRLFEYVDSNPDPRDLVGLWLDAFWAAVDAVDSPRTREAMEQALATRRAIRAHILGDTHAHDRPRADAAAAAGRKSDAAAAELFAYLSETYGPERHRDRAGRAPAHDDASEVRPCS